jgi:ssDNA-specific exonuclease RecJ
MNLRNILIFGLVHLSFLSVAQERESESLPLFDPLPYFSISDSISGWSLSSDGQWIDWPNIIPPIGISRNEDFYEAKHNQFGIDNIKNLSAHHVKYGKDTLICLIKTFSNGEYKYPARKKGWKNYTDAYYCIFHYKDLKKALAFFEEKDDEEVHVLRIKTLDSKLLIDIRENNIIENIKASVIINPNYDRNLVLTLQNNKRSETLYFHISNLHEIFYDVEGVRKPFSRRGRSVYGSTQLFNYLYFEVDKKDFFEVLNVRDALLQKELDLLGEESEDDSYDWDFDEDEV